MWIYESGALAASPDGIIYKSPNLPHLNCQTSEARTVNTDIHKVKCPYSIKDMSVMEFAKSANRNKFLGIYFIHKNVCIILKLNVLTSYLTEFI